ncbi:MAG TPA: hypothetical protein VIQ31_32200 [Phormidium sp.]
MADLATLQVLELAARTQSHPATSQMLSRLQKSLGVQDSRLEQSLWGLSLKNPVGLAAGQELSPQIPPSAATDTSKVNGRSKSSTILTSRFI